MATEETTKTTTHKRGSKAAKRTETAVKASKTTKAAKSEKTAIKKLKTHDKYDDHWISKTRNKFC